MKRQNASYVTEGSRRILQPRSALNLCAESTTTLIFVVTWNYRLRANYTCDHQIRELYQCHEATPANRMLRALAACQSDLCGARTRTAFCPKLVKEASGR